MGVRCNEVYFGYTGSEVVRWAEGQEKHCIKVEFSRQLGTGFGAQRTRLNQRDLVPNLSALKGKRK